MADKQEPQKPAVPNAPEPPPFDPDPELIEISKRGDSDTNESERRR